MKKAPQNREITYEIKEVTGPFAWFGAGCGSRGTHVWNIRRLLAHFRFPTVVTGTLPVAGSAPLTRPRLFRPFHDSSRSPFEGRPLSSRKPVVSA